MNDILKDKTYKKFFDRISEKAFMVEGKGVCLPFKLVDNILRQAIQEAKMERGYAQSDYWGEPIDNEL